MNAADIAEALAGRSIKPTGGNYLVRCPAHDDREPSLSLRDGDRGLLVRCFAGCDPRVVLAELRRRGFSDDAVVSPRRRSTAPTMPSPGVGADDRERTRRVLGIWGETHDPRDTLAWSYLARRGIDLDELPEDIEGVLRWHPHCPWGAGGAQHACIVALWTDAITGEPRAIHRRPITASGEKADVWRALGPTSGCVIRLWSDEAVTHGLVIGEGTETTLAAATRIQHRSTRLTPAWAAGDARHLEALPVLAGIETLTILVDHDESGRGQRAAAECAHRWAAAGREVIRLTPRRDGTDFNDLITW
jgi:Toprim domain